MVEMLFNDSVAKTPYKVVINDKYYTTFNMHESYAISLEAKKWCIANCKGYYYISMFGYIDFELEEDYTLAVLTYG